TPDAIEHAAVLALESITLANEVKRHSEADAVETTMAALTGLPLMTLTHGDAVLCLAVLPDGRLPDGADDGKINLSPEDGGTGPMLPKDGSPVLSLAVMRDGRLARGGRDGTIKLWPKDAGTGPVVLIQDSPVTSLAVMLDGRLVSAGFDGRIRLWRGTSPDK